MLSNTRKKQIALLQMHLFIYTTLQNGLCLKKKTKQIIPYGKIVLKKEREKRRGGNLEFWEKTSFKFLF